MELNKGNIDLLALRSFSLLVEERSVSRAASRLGLTQPTMSRILAKLRRYFDDPLLLWAGGHMVATPRALALEAELRHIMITMQRLSTPHQSFDPKTDESTIRLVATGYFEIFLAKIMSEVAAQAPGIQIETRPPDYLRDTAALENGEIDFLVAWNARPAAILRSRALFTDKLVCIARADHPDLCDNDLTYEKFRKLPHVQYQIPGRTTMGELLEEKLSEVDGRQNVKFRVQNFMTVVEVVSNSNLVSIISRRFVTEFPQDKPLKILELPFRVPPMRISAFWHERMQSDPRSRWFRRLLVDVSKRDLG